ncbi:hypothetical protein DKG71_31380 [Streptomyces sp. NEAU-S7GS2]|nr:hypothetical protein DKG71_31380 [Streptomyces sp. NEAU-S7GS2]
MSLLGSALGHKSEQVAGTGCRAAGPLPVAPEGLRPSADLVFYGTLYVDMVPEEVPVLWGPFSSALGEC